MYLWETIPRFDYNCYSQHLALPVREIIGVTPKFAMVGLFFGWTLRMFWPNLKSVSALIPETITIRVLGGVVNPQSWGRGRHTGSGMVPFKRAFASSYRPSIVTFPLSLRVSEILSLLCSSTPLFPIPPLVSPNFPHVPLGVGEWPLRYEEQRCWANCPCNYFPRFPTYVILIH